MLFDWLIVGQVIEANPAAAVRAAKHVVKKGKTPVLKADEARQLLDSIPLKIGPEPKDGEADNRPPSLIGLRDRALIGVMVYSFARVSAALGMKVEDYYTEGTAGLVPPAREGRQAPRGARPPQRRRLPGRLPGGGGHRRREENPPLPLHRPATGS